MSSDVASDLFYTRAQISTRLPLVTRRLHQQGRSIPLSRLLYHDFSLPLPQLNTAIDPRDIISALLGAITDNDKLGIQANYHLSIREVFTAATRAMYNCDNDGLDIDVCTPSDRHQSDLPSWVVDWRKIGPEGCQTWPINRHRRWPEYNATGGMDVPTPVFIDGDNHHGILRRYGYFVDAITEVWRYHEESYDRLTPEGREKEKILRLSSVSDFVQLPQTSGPGEDYVWRTLQSCYNDVSKDTHREISSFIRSIMRQQAISQDRSTTSQIAYLDTLPLPVPDSLTWTATEKLSNAINQVQDCVFIMERGRTLFRTQKGMLSLGHKFVQPGDVVTLLLSVHSPIVLHSSREGDFTFAGDAYVDRIMLGEFPPNEPC